MQVTARQGAVSIQNSCAPQVLRESLAAQQGIASRSSWGRGSETES